jgi:DNA polymerase-4
MRQRKIVHIDMDAFYASVEQRDDPQLRGKPVIVAWRGNRSVVCAASYEARTFGVRSAMPAVRAEHLCPNAVFLPPDFPRYRAVSRQVREILKRHTHLIEPLSLDEAYLDVSENKTGLPTATQGARTIREQIRSELGLTASAGASPRRVTRTRMARLSRRFAQRQPVDLEDFHQSTEDAGKRPGRSCDSTTGRTFE